MFDAFVARLHRGFAPRVAAAWYAELDGIGVTRRAFSDAIAHRASQQGDGHPTGAFSADVYIVEYSGGEWTNVVHALHGEY